MWRDPTPAFGRELADECEAFVQGRLVELLVDAGEPVPAWAWINLLAHGEEAELRDPPIHGLGPKRPLWEWSQGRAALAQEVLEQAAAFPSLRAFQAAAMVPLELDLIASPILGRLRADTWTFALRSKIWVRSRRPSEP